MPLFFFDLHEGVEVSRDRHGIELESSAAAYAAAVKSVRGMVAADVVRGFVSLSGEVVIRGEDLEVIRRVPFREAVIIRGSS